VAAAAAAMLGSHGAAAQNYDIFALSPEQLFDAMVMSVSRTPERLGEAPAAIYVLTGEDIVRSGATSIPEALRLVPGVQVARVNGAGWAISVRGFAGSLANKLLVLIDGREVYDPLFSGVYWDIQDTALEDIDRIEVIRGPGATLWGANAVNGVINIITKSAADTHGFQVSALAGNVENANVTARAGGQYGENLHWRLFGKYRSREASRDSIGLDMEDEWEAWRGGLRLDWDAMDGNAVSVIANVYNSESGQYRSVPQLTAPYAVTHEEEISAHGANFLARWNRELENDSRFSLQAYWALTARDQLTLEDSRSVLDFETQYELPQLDRHKITFGGHYRYTSVALESSPVITAPAHELSEQLFSGFIQDRIAIVPEAWFLTLGSKFEHNDFTGFEAQPSARLHWLGDNQSFWTSVSRAVRTPSELENDLRVRSGVIPPGLFPVPVAVDLIPSPSFDSEELIAYEAGYRRQWSPEFLTDFSAYYNEYDGLATLSLQAPELILSPPAHLILPILITNSTTAETYGFEAVANWRAAPNINFSAAYTYLHIALDGPPPSAAINAEAAETVSPNHQFNVRAQWDVRDGIALDAILYYVDSIEGFQTDEHFRLDMRLGWSITERIGLELVGQNLLEESHREFGGPGTALVKRAIYGRLTWRS
jgi:iron complex outermembrane receptor protein